MSAASPALPGSTKSALLRRFRAQVFAVTWLSYAGFYLCRNVYAVVKEPLELRFGFTDEQIAVPWTVYLVTYMLGQFFAAGLGRHFESRRVLAYGMTVAAACNVALGLLVDAHRGGALVWMCVTMGIFGMAQATGWPHNVALFANWTRRSERGTLYGLWGTSYQFGALAGRGLAGFMLGWLGVAWSFFGSSIALFAITVAFVLLARERPQSVGLSLEEETEADAPNSGSGAAAGTKALPPPPGFVRSIVAMGLIYFGFKFLRYALASWSALILSEHFKLSPAIAAFLSTAFDWLGVLGVIAAGYWSDRTAGSRRTPVIFYMTCGCFLFTALLWLIGLSSAALFAVLLGAIGFLQNGPDALLAGACAMDVGDRRQAALAAGVIDGCGSIGPIVQEPLIAWLLQTSGVNSVLLLLMTVGFVTTIGTGLLMRFQRGRV